MRNEPNVYTYVRDVRRDAVRGIQRRGIFERPTTAATSRVCASDFERYARILSLYLTIPHERREVTLLFLSFISFSHGARRCPLRGDRTPILGVRSSIDPSSRHLVPPSAADANLLPNYRLIRSGSRTVVGTEWERRSCRSCRSCLRHCFGRRSRAPLERAGRPRRNFPSPLMIHRALREKVEGAPSFVRGRVRRLAHCAFRACNRKVF